MKIFTNYFQLKNNNCLYVVLKFLPLRVLLRSFNKDILIQETINNFVINYYSIPTQSMKKKTLQRTTEIEQSNYFNYVV